MGHSKFDGGLGSYLFMMIVNLLIVIFTLGICSPWAICNAYRWKTEHTIIDGRRLKFNGTAIGLFGSWIKWFFLTIITFGIYGFWVFIQVEKWKVSHTTFEN